MTREIELSQEKFAIVDDDDYQWIMDLEYVWYAIYSKDKDRYRWYAIGYKNGKYELMHRLILDPPKNKQVDHIDGDGLNNRRSNLRVCNQSQNNANSRLRKSKTCKYRGVYIDPTRKKKYRASITVNGKNIKLGSFDNPEDAASAYNKAAEKHFGEFARLNDVR